MLGHGAEEHRQFPEKLTLVNFCGIWEKNALSVTKVSRPRNNQNPILNHFNNFKRRRIEIVYRQVTFQIVNRAISLSPVENPPNKGFEKEHFLSGSS